MTPNLKGDSFTEFRPDDLHFRALVQAACLNTEAVFMTFEEDVLKRQTKGDASESGIIKFIEPV